MPYKVKLMWYKLQNLFKVTSDKFRLFQIVRDFLKHKHHNNKSEKEISII